jgi:hypothetical protein
MREQTKKDWEKESIKNAKAALDRGDNKTAFLIIISGLIISRNPDGILVTYKKILAIWRAT